MLPRDLIPRDERPPLRIPRWMRVVGRLCAPALGPVLCRRRARREVRLNELLAATRECKNRFDLETVLGDPCYAMLGDRYRVAGIRPDIVEVYHRHGCAIEYCFRGNEVCSVIGYIPWTPWELAAGCAGRHD